MTGPTSPAERSAKDAGSPGTLPRPKDLRASSPWMKVGMALFFVGALAILADVVLFASGVHDLPLWLNLCALLAPIGFGVGMIGAFVEARAAAKPAAEPAE